MRGEEACGRVITGLGELFQTYKILFSLKDPIFAVVLEDLSSSELQLVQPCLWWIGSPMATVAPVATLATIATVL